MTQPSIWDDPSLTGELGQKIADDLRDMARQYDAESDRSAQAALGPSEIGDPCTRCLASKILGIPVEKEPTDFEDGWRAIVGTAVHAWLDEAAVAANVRDNDARWYPEMRVQPDQRLLPSGGKSDLYDAHTRTVIDHKTVSKTKLGRIKNDGPGIQKRRQAHLYGLGYANAGHQVDNVALAFWVREGAMADLWIWTEEYDEQIAREALTRFETLRTLCQTGGVEVLDSLPQDADCPVCSPVK